MKGKISLEDLVEQFLDQCRSGNVPDIQDFAGAHPEFASELLALLPLVMEMEALKKNRELCLRFTIFPIWRGTITG